MTLSSQHHSFDIELASQYGIPVAILIHHFQHWINFNARLGRNFHDERTWMYQSLQEIAAHFPYFSHKQIERLINKMVDLNILVKGNYNSTPYDRTCWYAFNDEKMFSISPNREIEISESGNRNLRIGKYNKDTDTETDTETNTCCTRAHTRDEEQKAGKPGKAPHVFTKTLSTGKSVRCDLDEFYLHMVREKIECPTHLVDEAWNVLYAHQGPLSSWKKYLVGIINNLLANHKEHACRQTPPPQTPDRYVKPASKSSVEKLERSLLEKGMRIRRELALEASAQKGKKALTAS